jgi:general secretion pathway protein D
MMRAALLSLLLAVSGASAAPSPVQVVPTALLPMSFDFNGVPVMQFAQAIYRDALGRDFVVSSDLVDSQKKVSIRIKALTRDKLPGFVDQVLRSQGIASSVRDGVYYLDVAKDRSDDSTISGSAPSPAAVASSAAGDSRSDPKPAIPDKLVVVKAVNRPAEFLAAAMGGIFGPAAAKVGSGSLLVLSVPDGREKVMREVLAQLDAAPRSIEIVASFVEVTRTGTDKRGLALFTSALARHGLQFDTSSGQASLSLGSYQVVMDALASDGRFKQVSNSRLVGDEGEKLSLLVGDETPTISSTSKDNQGNPIQNVVYRPSGVILDVLPKVTGSGRLALAVDGQVSSFQTTKTGVAGSPTLVKRQVKTSVSVDDGQVLVIGGLDDSKLNEGTSGFAFLPDTWRGRSKDDSKTDLVLVLSARVLK